MSVALALLWHSNLISAQLHSGFVSKYASQAIFAYISHSSLLGLLLGLGLLDRHSLGHLRLSRIIADIGCVADFSLWLLRLVDLVDFAHELSSMLDFL